VGLTGDTVGGVWGTGGAIGIGASVVGPAVGALVGATTCRGTPLRTISSR